MILVGLWQMQKRKKKSWIDAIVLSEIYLCWCSWLAVSTFAPVGSWSGWQPGQTWPAVATVPGTEGKAIEMQCDGHNGCDRLAVSTGFLLLWPEINHKYPHWHPPTARQASTTTHTLKLRQAGGKKTRQKERRRAWLVRGAVKHKPSR